MTKNNLLFAILTLAAVVFLSGCVQQASTAPGANGVVDCKSDQACLHSNFLACIPARFEMPFINDTKYSITVIGAENGACRYDAGVTGMMESVCVIPLTLMTEDRFGHLFGAEKVPGKETIAVEQERIDTDYCR